MFSEYVTTNEHLTQYDHNIRSSHESRDSHNSLIATQHSDYINIEMHRLYKLVHTTHINIHVCYI